MTLADAGAGGRARAAPVRAAARSAGRGAPAAAETSIGMPLLVSVYLVSLVVPIFIQVGSLQLMPYRIVLLAAFFPAAMRMFSGQTGRVAACDWLIMAAVGWHALALIVNHGAAGITSGGMQTLEVFGSWLVARVGIRNADDFRRMVKLMFLLIVILLPFAIVESVTKRPFLLQMIPSSPRPVYNPERFGLRRAQTVFSHPILYGAFVASMMGMVWFALNPAASFMSRAMRGAIVFLGMFFSLSSGAIVGFVIQCAMIGWDMITRPDPTRWKTFLWLTAGLYVFLDIASNRSPFHLVVDYATFSSGSSYYRILIFRYGMENVWANPIFGLGFGNWQRAAWMTGNSVDNYWLLHAMRYGIPGFALLAAAYASGMLAAARARLSDPVAREMRIGWMISLAGVIVAGGTVHYWTSMSSFVTFLFAAGLWVTRADLQAAPDAEEVAGPGRRRAASSGRPRAPAPGGGRPGPAPAPTFAAPAAAPTAAVPPPPAGAHRPPSPGDARRAAEAAAPRGRAAPATAVRPRFGAAAAAPPPARPQAAPPAAPPGPRRPLR